MKAAALAVLLAALAAAAPGTTPPQYPPWGLSLEYLDASVAPGENFFRHANGLWLRTATIPTDRRVAGVNLEVQRANEAKLRAIVASLVAAPAAQLSDEERKLRDLYLAFVDTAAIEAAGLTPVAKDLERIAALASPAAVAEFMASPPTHTDGPFDYAIIVDEKNPGAYIVNLTHSGLGLPDRDYYLRADPKLEATRAAYRKYLTDMLALGGVHDAARAAAVYELELRIARAHWPAEDRREVEKTYNLMSLSQLEQLAPGFPWRAYLGAAGVPPAAGSRERRLDVAEKSAFPKLAALFAATPLPVWRDYLTVHYLHEHAHYLPKEFDGTDFAFYGVILRGQKQPLPRELRGIQLLDEEMGEALGKLYCARYFPPEAKAKSEQLVNNILTAFAQDLTTLEWMSPPTRAKALAKLHAIRTKIGYPEQWRDYGRLVIPAGDLIGAVRNAEVFEWQRQLARLDGPVDRGEWLMTPPTNNDYYAPDRNEIVFPAGSLQPPFFDANADDAINYGEIGATIGHEISHAFDDQGAKFDATGRLSDWWTDADRRSFEARTARLVKQYAQYQVLPGLYVNGRLTLGENIADVAGLVMARKGYQIALGGHPAPVLDGLTGEQRFYLAFAQSYREIWTEELLREAVLSDPHTPDEYRINGAVRNDAGWYAAFPAVKPGDAYYLAPEERVSLW